MKKEYLTGILNRIKKGTLTVEKGLEALKGLPYLDLEFAKLDLHRELRRGLPEAVYCEGKSLSQIKKIVRESLKNSSRVILTRLTEARWRHIRKQFPQLKFNKIARFAYSPPPRTKKTGFILVITAGTADVPVAEEAAVTAEIAGSRVKRLYDVGVAGIHRVFENRELLEKASVCIVVAGMDGALPSVVGGLVSKPVIAVPTSVGYGANFGGVAPLLTMLNTCAPGVVCVNIDNGFGAGYFASLLQPLQPRRAPEHREGAE